MMLELEGHRQVHKIITWAMGNIKKKLLREILGDARRSQGVHKTIQHEEAAQVGCLVVLELEGPQEVHKTTMWTDRKHEEAVEANAW